MPEEINRESAWELLTEHTKSESLRKHALAVEILMRGYAQKLGEDPEIWGIVGLLHDFDYELFPTAPDHPQKGAEILRRNGYPEEIIYAISSHVEAMNLPRHNTLCKAILACDELAGFLVASALVRPGKSILGLKVKSVRKKLKDKAFARAVNREEIYQAAADFGVDLSEHITFCIQAMEEKAAVLGLDGAAELARFSHRVSSRGGVGAVLTRRRDRGQRRRTRAVRRAGRPSAKQSAGWIRRRSRELVRRAG